MQLNIKGETITLPRSVLDRLSDADAADLRVLLYIAGADAFDEAEAAAALQLSEAEVRSSVKYWRGAGVIARKSAAKEAKKEAPAPKKEPAAKKPLREKTAAKLTANELCEIAEENADFRALIDMAQQTAGWMFNTAEIQIIASLYTTLRLSGEYILALVNYFVAERKKPLRYLEKVAYSFIDEGVDTAAALEEKLRWLERFDGRAGAVRKLFGLGARELTAREKDYLVNWFDVYGYGDDLVELAYEKTVNATGKASLAYANGILKKWYADGVKTVADVDREAARATSVASSFDVNDAFSRALNRSYANGDET